MDYWALVLIFEQSNNIREILDLKSQAQDPIVELIMALASLSIVK